MGDDLAHSSDADDGALPGVDPVTVTAALDDAAAAERNIRRVVCPPLWAFVVTGVALGAAFSLKAMDFEGWLILLVLGVPNVIGGWVQAAYRKRRGVTQSMAAWLRSWSSHMRVVYVIAAAVLVTAFMLPLNLSLGWAVVLGVAVAVSWVAFGVVWRDMYINGATKR
ncbi:MAG: hypothetical protein FWF02_04500 [Micrococcales bacterium]|nr:hypothetical protein [Micrococcales bacterium]MCL2666952.1 hypothetical protein [Micrococcales bacterium]